MESPAEKRPPRKWLAVAFAVIAAAIVALGLSPLGREWIARLTASGDDMRADVEKTFDDLKTYQAIKEHYPEAYEELIRLTIKDVRNGADAETAMIEGAEFTTNLRRQNAQYYAMASVERLRLSLNAQIPQYAYLKTAYGFKACNELAVNGGVAIARMLGPQFVKDKTLTQMMDESTGYFFRTTAEGRKLKLHHEQPTNADWQTAADYLKSKGMTDGDLQLIGEPQKHLDDARLCDVTIKFYQNITTMDNDPAKRIVPYLAASAAAG